MIIRYMNRKGLLFIEIILANMSNYSKGSKANLTGKSKKNERRKYV